MGTQDITAETKNRIRRLADEVWAIAKALPSGCRELASDLKSISTKLHGEASKMGG